MARGRGRSPGDGAQAVTAHRRGRRQCAGEDGARFSSSPLLFSSFPLLLPFFSLNRPPIVNFSVNRSLTVEIDRRGRFLAVPPDSERSAYRQPGGPVVQVEIANLVSGHVRFLDWSSSSSP
ncbi:hypothetical protein BHM03_00021626 [Ensete ventricosum]|nr:hypothetical protein BHM03_00021626 [Ensete ventricosum]